MKFDKYNKTFLTKLISILLSVIVSYFSSYRILLNDNEYGRNFGYLSFLALLIIFYFVLKRGVPYIVRLINSLIRKISDKQISERDILYKILLIPSIIYSIIGVILFFITTRFVYITWVYNATTYAEEKKLLNTNAEFMVVGLLIVSIILFVSLFYVLIKNGIKLPKTLAISLITILSIILFFYMVPKVLHIILLILMLILSILIFGAVG